MQNDEQLREENARLRALLAERDTSIAVLQARIDWLNQRLFGPGKSEKIDRLQCLLELDEVREQLHKLSGEKTKVPAHERLSPKPRREQARAEQFEKLPVNETVVIEPQEVLAAPQDYELIGEEKTFEVDVTAPQLFKRAIIRRKYRFLIDRSRPPVVAPAPKRPIEGGYASAGLLSWVVTSKYLDHLPLYRIEKMTQRWGARLARQTTADWIETVAMWLKPIYDRMRQELIEGDYVQADETPVKFIDPDEKKGQSSQGYLWVIGRPGGPVVFDWRLSRRHEEATSLLSGFSGVLQSDGYGAYKAAANTKPELVRVACLAHVRRKFFESAQHSPREAKLALAIIGRIYQRERLYREEELKPQERTVRRKREQTILFKRLHKLAIIGSQRSRPKEPFGKACAYTLGQWPAIERLLENGIAELDNNLIENAIRPSAIGKKNWLFIGHPDAGGRSAIIYSIVVTCQRFGINPESYLRDVLTRLPQMSNQDDLAPLLPHAWQPATS